MLLNCGAGEDSWESLGQQGPITHKGNQPWIFIERTDAEAEAPILWSPDVKSWLIGKDPDAGKAWRQKEKRVSEDENMNCNNYSPWFQWKALFTSVAFSKIHNPRLILREKNTNPNFFKMKSTFQQCQCNKERMRNCHKLEETNETWCLSAMSYPSLILEQKKGIIRKADVYAQQNNLLSVIYLILPYDINLLPW